MSKYIRLYNEIMKITRFANELIKLGEIQVPKKFCGEEKYMIGPYVKFLLDGSGFNLHYELTNDAADINKMEDYNKYIMNRDGEVFTTPTGLIARSFYYLEDPNKFIPYYLHHNNVDELVVVYLKKKNLLRGDIKTAFLLKYKYKIPKFILYKILIELSHLHINNLEPNLCDKCKISIHKENKCHDCNVCLFCKTFNNIIYNCISCNDTMCRRCKIEGLCEYCYQYKYRN